LNKSKRIRNIIILPIIAVCFLLFLSQPALAATYYVSPSGNDANNGLSTSAAWENPGYAASKAVAGDTIYLMNGIWYDQHLVFNKQGTSTAPINVKAYSGTPTLDGVDKTGIGIKIYSSSWINIEGIKVRDYQYGYWASSSNNLKITKCEFSDTSLDGITLWNDVDYMAIDSVTVKNTGSHGIHVWNQNHPGRSQYITVKNSAISNAPHNLLDIHTNVTDVLVENNEFFYTLDYTGVKDVGVYLHNGNTDNIVIKNNYFHDFGRSLEIYNSHNVQVLDNTFRNINGRAIFLAGIQGYDDEFGVFESVFKGNTFDNVNYAFAFWAADSKFRNLDLLDNNYLKVLNKDYLVPDQYYVALSGNSGFPQILTSTNKYYTVKDIAASPYITSPITDKPPIANAGADITITAGSSVTFNGGASTDDKGISSYSWDFDASNGIQKDATGKTVSRVFNTAGKFTVTLTVTDTFGQRSSDTLILTVSAPVTPISDKAPVANAGYDRVTTVGKKVYFGGDRSTDDRDLVSYSWDFDASNGIQADAVGMYVSTTFSTAKTYTVTLTVTDTIGQKSSDTVLVAVSAPATSIPDKIPVANAGPDITITAGSSVTFNGGASTDDKGISSYSWDFDSSNDILDDVTGKTVSKVFSKAGKFTVTLTVTDIIGQRSSDTLIVTVNAPVVSTPDEKPIANAGYDRVTTVGQKVYFGGDRSTDDRGLVSYSWDFDSSNGMQADALGMYVSTTFDAAKTYTVTLTVTDTGGQKSSDTVTVQVNPVNNDGPRSTA